MKTAPNTIQALGKKLKRRTLKRLDWEAVRRELRLGSKSTTHPEALHRMALVIDRHAPTLYDVDPLALRATYIDRFVAWGKVNAARHMIRLANGRPGLSHAYPRVSPAFNIRGWFKSLQIAKLPDSARAA